MTASYTYLFCDLLTDRVLAEIELSGVSYGFALNAPGAFTAQLPLGSPQMTALDPIAATVPGRTAVWVLHGEPGQQTVEWGGILWGRNRTRSGRTLSLTGATFDSFYDHNFQETKLAYDGASSASDQMQILSDILTQIAALDGGDIGLLFPPVALSGVRRQLAVAVSEDRSISSIIADLRSPDDGFDWAVQVQGDMSARTKTLLAGFPHLGVSAADSEILFELVQEADLRSGGGNIIDYAFPEDALTGAVRQVARGAGNGTTTPRSVAVSSALLADGWPRSSAAKDYQITSATTLAGMAAAQLTADTPPIITPSFTVRAETDPPLGTYMPGDSARFQITDECFPRQRDGSPGFDQMMRITGITITPDAKGVSRKVAITVDQQPEMV